MLYILKQLYLLYLPDCLFQEPLLQHSRRDTHPARSARGAGFPEAQRFVGVIGFPIESPRRRADRVARQRARCGPLPENLRNHAERRPRGFGGRIATEGERAPERDRLARELPQERGCGCQVRVRGNALFDDAGQYQMQTHFFLTILKRSTWGCTYDLRGCFGCNNLYGLRSPNLSLIIKYTLLTTAIRHKHQ